MLSKFSVTRLLRLHRTLGSTRHTPGLTPHALLYSTLPTKNMNPDVKRIISFWFDRDPIEWIIAPEGLDDQLKAEFSDLVMQARRNELEAWTAEPESSLALVVLLDQFSRNIFRGSVEVFSGDQKAWEAVTKAVARDFDKRVTVIQASAFYMPLLQRESSISVIAARSLFEALKGRCESAGEHKWVDMGVAASKRHLKQLEDFGRYPTRNALLGRENTKAEETFLEQHKQKPYHTRTHQELVGKPIFITEKGVVGIATASIKPGDFLSWIHGSPILVLLQGVQGQDNDLEDTYRIVARTVVDGRSVHSMKDIKALLDSIPSRQFKII